MHSKIILAVSSNCYEWADCFKWAETTQFAFINVCFSLSLCFISPSYRILCSTKAKEVYFCVASSKWKSAYDLALFVISLIPPVFFSVSLLLCSNKPDGVIVMLPSCFYGDEAWSACSVLYVSALSLAQTCAHALLLWQILKIWNVQIVSLSSCGPNRTECSHKQIWCYTMAGHFFPRQT